MPEWVEASWPYLSTGASIVLSAVVSVHVILHKREVRAAIGWVGIIWLVPLVGVLLYWLLGINRIQRKALKLRLGTRRYRHELVVAPVVPDDVAGKAHLVELSEVVERVTTRPLLPGNDIRLLIDGDEAYPAMLEAIAGAQRSISLMTYIFDDDPVGRRFVDALVTAKERGVEVRVLVDALGVRYTLPPIDRRLRWAHVPVARFMRVRHATHFNLRNHRKALVVDGRVGFTGGLNIRQRCVLAGMPRNATRDLHFRIEGPLVAQLQEIFAEDWELTTRETLWGPQWFPDIVPAGDMLARSIADGPDEITDKIKWVLVGAISCARSSIRILTPYFLPDASIATALNVAAMRGVRVEIVVPERGNIRVLSWAMWASFFNVLGHGCRLWQTPAPFDHSKVLVVDDHWVLFGSANWDPRSLRLNFELAVECYDGDLARRMARLVDERKGRGREVTVADLERRSFAIRLRDGLARLMTPYL